MSADRIDLNLLRVFDAIYEDRNLAHAGKRLGEDLRNRCLTVGEA